MQKGKFSKKMMPEGYFSVYPIPEESELKELYNREYYQEAKSSSYQSKYSESEIRYKKVISDQIVYAIEQFHVSSHEKKFLEIGFGEGFTMAAAQRNEWEIMGLELTNVALRKFHPNLLEFTMQMDVCEGIKHFRSEDSCFDAVVLQNVLEHVREPEKVLDELHEILEPSGILSITVPNDESLLQLDLLQRGSIDREYWFVPPQHLHYFNSENFGNLVSKKGYRIIDMYSDFPIEYFLYQPSSNYITNKDQGTLCQNARIAIFNQLASNGMNKLHNLCQAQAQCGIGRAMTFLLQRV